MIEYQAVIGLEVHAELATQSKMFCACAVVDSTLAEPNSAVCPVCAGMPGVLPVVNRRAVEFGLRVALALGCQVNPLSIFARKNYFYPDLPKGYQISQYEQPLASNGRLLISTSQGEKVIRIRRVHLEEDTGKLTHVEMTVGPSPLSGIQAEPCTLVNLNRAGVPLLEIVTEPDMHSAQEVRQFVDALRSILRYLGVNSGDMQKGVLRIEPNISVHPTGSTILGTRTEVKNLNSLRALERSVEYEIHRQVELLQRDQAVYQETRGWDEAHGVTVLQRRKETEDDYRYFPEPDLPPLVIEPAWLEQIRLALPELPDARQRRFQGQYALNSYLASQLVAEPALGAYYENAVKANPQASPQILANWIIGDLFALLNQTGLSIEQIPLPPEAFAELVSMVLRGELNQNSARAVLAEMFASGKSAATIVADRQLSQISDSNLLADLVQHVLAEHPAEVAAYHAGKVTVANFLFGQVMHRAKGQANPQLLRTELERQLALSNGR